jgi:SAM-dependent methyltransferase
MRKKRNLVTPSLLDHYYLEGIGRVSKLKEVFSKNFGKRTNKTRPVLLLDLGGRESPYEQLAQGLPVKWISVDIKKYGRTDVMLEGQRLPFQSGAFDAVLCTQVLGYVPDIFAATHEIYRILKAHGVAILSESAIFPPYGEGARWRILPEGWKSLLEPFSECRVDAECNTVASFFRVLNLYLAILLQNRGVLEKIWRFIFCPLFNLFGWWANGRFKDIGFAANYFVVAKK